MRTALAVLLCCLLLAGCGGTVIISVNSGLVLADAACHNGGGQFDMRNDSGLLLLVVIGEGTVVFLSSGATGSCANIHAGARARVSGNTKNGQINANQVQLQ